MRTLTLKNAILAMSIVSSTLFLPKAVYSQETSLSIYPPLIEVKANPPASPLAPISLKNNTEENVTLKIQLHPFRSNNTDGSVILDPSLKNKGFYPFYENRIQFLVDDKKASTITLEANEEKELMLNVNISKGDPPGDYYYSIIFLNEGTKPQDSSISQIPSGIASNLLLSVSPQGKASAGISQFHTDRFKSQGPVDFTLKLHNASKYLLKPTGEIRIYNILGQNVGKTSILPQYVLAGEDRFLTDKSHTRQAHSKTQTDPLPQVRWNEGFLLGVYKAVAYIQLEEHGQTIESTTYFVAFPLLFFIPLVILLFIILSIILRTRRKL